MWIVVDESLDQPDFFQYAGKALFLCQHFEAICKEIIMWLHSSKALQEKRFKFLSDEHRDFVDDLLRAFLGKSIERFREEFGEEFGDEDITSITRAKVSPRIIPSDQ